MHKITMKGVFMLYTLKRTTNDKIYYRRSSESIESNHHVVEIGYNSVPKCTRQIFNRDLFIIHYVTSGYGKCMDKEFSKNHCYFIVPNELEITESSPINSYECCWIMLKGENSKEILSKCGFPEHNSVFPFNAASECAKIIQNYLFNKKYENDLVEACKLEELLYKLLAFHMKSNSVNNSSNYEKDNRAKAKMIARYIENNYQLNIKISDLCNIFHISTNHLCTIFKERYNISPKEYLLRYRISKAKQLLKEVQHNISISEISNAVGIENPLYFSRLFHQKEGVSPSEYRTTKRKEMQD